MIFKKVAKLKKLLFPNADKQVADTLFGKKGIDGTVPILDGYPFRLFNEKDYQNGILAEKSFTNAKDSGEMIKLAGTQRIAEDVVGVIGQTIDGKSLVLARFDEIHSLITGMTRGGKTNFLRALALSLGHYNHPEFLRVICMDMKRDSFYEFRNVMTCLTGFKNCAKAIIKLSQIMHARKNHASGCLPSSSSVKAAYDTRKRYMLNPYIVVIFDEYGFFIETAKKLAADKSADFDLSKIEDMIHEICQLGAGLGISLILGTQASYVEQTKGIIKNNLERRMTFKLGDPLNYAQTLGTQPKDYIIDYDAPKGTLIVKHLGGWRNLKALLCTDKAIEIAVQKWTAQKLNFSL